MTEILLLISAGKGPQECEWVAHQLADHIGRDAGKAGVKVRPLESGEGSLLLALSGADAGRFIKPFVGTVQWIGQSPFRPNHKRKNWFVGVSLLPAPEKVAGFNEEDVSFQTMKAGGPGGQHVNTTDSAVRATHGPTGLSVVAREERSQHANRKLALRKLAALMAERSQAQANELAGSTWLSHQSLERGNAVRVYEGPKFRLKRSA